MPNDEWTFVQRKKYSRGSQISVDNYSWQSTVFSSQGSRGSGSQCSFKSVVDPKHPRDPKAPINISPSPSPTSPSPQNKTRQQPLPPVFSPTSHSSSSPAVLQPTTTTMASAPQHYMVPSRLLSRSPYWAPLVKKEQPHLFRKYPNHWFLMLLIQMLSCLTFLCPMSMPPLSPCPVVPEMMFPMFPPHMRTHLGGGGKAKVLSLGRGILNKRCF